MRPSVRRALELIDRAVELSPDDDRPLLVKGTILANAGRQEDAQALLQPR